MSLLASELASETLTGVTQLKCLFTNAILYFDPRVFVLVMWPTPLNRIPMFIDQYPYHPRNLIVYRFEFFVSAVKT